ncbi:carboxylate--amine ligase [Salinisphaera aquimarina]|uniref:FAD-dependent oxidoreductase n=1 Tax=Salinisphaera aquimarina TaxID=2094031 RepID=A0ABV7EQ96_9GAMM
MTDMQRRFGTPAIVVGGGLNGLGVVRSLGRAGVPVIVADSDAKAPGMRSRYARALRYDADTADGLSTALNSVARDKNQDRPVLILTTEKAVAFVTREYYQLEKMFHMTLSPPAAVQACTHKSTVMEIAQAAGLAHPRTVAVRQTADIEAIKSLRPPLIVKPAYHDSGYSKIFRKAYCVPDRESTITLVERMLPTLADIIVQEWIPGADSDIYFCLQYRPRGSGQPVSFVGRKLRSWPPRTGGTASCMAAPEAETVIDSTNDFFAKAGISGLVSMEYKRDSSDGRYMVVEPTVGRTDFQEEIATLNGVNIPLAAYCDSLGLELPKSTTPSPRIWRERISDSRSAADPLAESVDQPPGISATDALYRWHDPAPGIFTFIDRVHNWTGRSRGG